MASIQFPRPDSRQDRKFFLDCQAVLQEEGIRSGLETLQRMLETLRKKLAGTPGQAYHFYSLSPKERDKHSDKWKEGLLDDALGEEGSESVDLTELVLRLREHLARHKHELDLSTSKDSFSHADRATVLNPEDEFSEIFQRAFDLSLKKEDQICRHLILKQVIDYVEETKDVPALDGPVASLIAGDSFSFPSLPAAQGYENNAILAYVVAENNLAYNLTGIEQEVGKALNLRYPLKSVKNHLKESFGYVRGEQSFRSALRLWMLSYEESRSEQRARAIARRHKFEWPGLPRPSSSEMEKWKQYLE